MSRMSDNKNYKCGEQNLKVNYEERCDIAWVAKEHFFPPDLKTVIRWRSLHQNHSSNTK